MKPPPSKTPIGPGSRRPLAFRSAVNVPASPARKRKPGWWRTAILAGVVLAACQGRAAIPPAEKLLPADTLLVISAPECTNLLTLLQQSPQGRLWNDPAMKPLREKFILRLQEDFVRPLERELGVKLEDYGQVLQGQLTFALTQNGWEGRGGTAPAALLLLDTRERGGWLRTNLAQLRQKWADAGKPIKLEKIRGVEFTILPLASNSVPQTLKDYLPHRQEIQELGREPAKPSLALDQWLVGQHESLLIMGSAPEAVEKVMARLTGSDMPALGDDAGFEAARAAMFRNAAVFGWFHAKPLVDILTRLPPPAPNPEAPSPLPSFPVGKLVAASGLAGLQSAAFVVRHSSDGALYEVFLGAPESSRQGLVRILAAESKDSNPPPFVPADAVKFQRWRIDGQKAVAALEKALTELSAINTWNFLLSSGNDAVKVEEPNYDIRKDLIGNLGDDMISYQKPPRGNSPAERRSPPSLFLLGSPNAERLTAALRGALVLVSAEGLAPKQREFLGRKIFSVKLPPMPLFGVSTANTLHYAAAGGYVAFSTDPAMLEEYLRGAETQSKALREIPGLADAAQKVGGLNTGWFSYENTAESARLEFEALQKNPGGHTNAPPGALAPFLSSLPIAGPEKSCKVWLDPSLLPPFDQIAKHFYFTVFSASASVDGITFRHFSPLPPPSKQ